jgi:hypothetical protein
MPFDNVPWAPKEPEPKQTRDFFAAWLAYYALVSLALYTSAAVGVGIVTHLLLEKRQ